MSVKHAINKHTYDNFNEIWNSNSKINYFNIKQYKKLSALEFKGKQPIAVVCGSGVSLENSIDFIKANRDIVNVFCAETTTPILVKNGIIPDFICNIDATDISQCMSEIDLNLLKDTKFIAATVSHPNTIEAFGHSRNTYLFNLRDAGSDVLNKVEILYGLTSVPAIVSKCNIGEFMVFLASRYLSYKYIAIAGIDFCYINNKIYAEGISHIAPTEKGCMSMINILNQPVIVPTIFYVYAMTFMKNYMELYRSISKIFNISEGILPLKYEKELLLEFISQIRKTQEEKQCANTVKE